ncbi:hypothetical protein SKAU_G00130710 [Synaphobranchus kaupii]|uniref:Complex 1 LYR protein domain-containing protein n=1 Tax=Synaphobranchus kaupii TaxID=118154 RepID=A0A9Q1FQC1_SYNKA|nr:hypothetical protein SKAU_G00130710 [Synaphobranchus kaupii]
MVKTKTRTVSDFPKQIPKVTAQQQQPRLSCLCTMCRTSLGTAKRNHEATRVEGSYLLLLQYVWLQGQMTAATRQEVLSLYRQVLRIARTWQAQSALPKDTDRERLYIAQEAQTLFRQNKQVTDPQSIKTYIEECKARIEIGLHYRNPYPRPTYLPPMGLATQKGRKLRVQERLRKQAKPIYLESYDEPS